MHRRALLCLLAVVPGFLTLAVGGSASAAERVTVTGRIQVLATMGSWGGHRTVTSLAVAGHSWQLRLPAGLTPRNGTVLRVTGTVTGGVLTADSARPVRLAPAVSTTGTHRLYVVRVQWSGNPSDGTTSADITTAFNGVSSWFNEVSYGKLSGFTVQQDPTFETIAAPSSCFVSSGTNQIYQRAVAAAGIDDDAYDHVVVYFPQAASGCSFAGLAAVGGNSVWLNGDLSNRVVTHELGHNLGLSHSHSLSCVDPSSAQTTISTHCSAPNEYGDPADTMGSEGADLAGHYNAAQKAQLGWLGSAGQTVAPCTSVSLNPYETLPGSGLVAARVDAGADPTTHQPRSYWFEYRHPSGGVDGAPPNGPLPAGLTDGALLHLTDPDVSVPSNPDFGSDLLDGKPQDDSFDFTDAALPAGSSVVTPEGYTFGVASVASTVGLTLSTAGPSVPRSPSADVQGSGVKVSWQAPGCVGTGASSVTGYHVSRVGGSSVGTAATSAVVPGVPGLGGAEYLVDATNDAAVTGAAAVVPASAPSITGRHYTTSSGAIYSNGVMFDFAPSVSNGGRSIVGYLLHGDPVGGAPPVDDSYYDVTSGRPHQIFLQMAKGDTYRVSVSAVFADGTTGQSSPSIRTTSGDLTAPSPTITAPKSAVTTVSTLDVRWTGSDSGGAGLASYDVRERVAPYNHDFGSYVSPKALQHTTSTSTTIHPAPASTYCFSVRARDNNGNTSKYSKEKCTSVPLDDSGLAADSRWSTVNDSAFYGGSASKATHKGAVLSRSHVHAKHLLLLATMCPSCGKVGVFVGSEKVASIDLDAASTKTSALVAVPNRGAINGDTVRLKVLSSGKPVTIDGLVVRAV